ncbi:hypothetical protein CR513_22302, partial [Mucuna pruriens]
MRRGNQRASTNGIHKDRRPQLVEDLKEVQIRLNPHEKTKIRASLTREVDEQLTLSRKTESSRPAKTESSRPAKTESSRPTKIESFRPAETESPLYHFGLSPSAQASIQAHMLKLQSKLILCGKFDHACSKDPYPLPSIDQLVDGSSRYDLLSFIDAYSRYNQIQMHPLDEEKMAFIIDNDNFCYQVMPFSLKNTGATYQRLMGRIFRDQIGQEMEIYIDDMVVKLSIKNWHYEALANVFATLRKHKLRLNPKKCSFDEFKKEQRLVYFIAKVLQGVETHYQRIKKATLALIIKEKRL